MYKKTIFSFTILIILIIFPISLLFNNVDSITSQSKINLHEKLENNISLDKKIESISEISVESGVYGKSLLMQELSDNLRFLYDQSSSSFSNSNFRHHNSTLTTARGLASLAITGLRGYVIPQGDEIDVFNGFGDNNDDGGYNIHKSAKESSIMGTYGVVLSGELLDLDLKLNQIKSDVINFILSNFKLNSGAGGFIEHSGLTDDQISISSTYYAIHALSILKFNFNTSFVSWITNYLEDIWNGNSFDSQSSFDLDQSNILNSFFAISTLSFLNKTNSINSTFWDEIKTEFSSYLSDQQVSTGPLLGGIFSPSSIANVIDTGSAISALHILNNTSAINLKEAVRFILDSQLPGPPSTLEKGGFTPNNLTHSDKDDIDYGVRLRNTYYALLGLYSSGYITNNTQLTFKTNYSSNNNLNAKSNEILPGHESLILSQITVLDQKGFYADNDISYSISGLDIEFNASREISSADGLEFIHKVVNTTANWTLGSHDLVATFSLNNFSLLPKIIINEKGSLLVRLPLITSINSQYQDFEAEPGDFLQISVEYENDSINTNYLGYGNSSLGNFSTHLVYPNGTSTQLNSSNEFELNQMTKFYDFNHTLLNNAPLGDYYINITYTNGTGIVFYSHQQIHVETQLSLIKIDSLNSNSEITPNRPFQLNFTIEYENHELSTPIDSIKANFLENSTLVKFFSVNLTQIGLKSFSSNNSELVPIDLFMGDYRVEIEINWTSKTTEDFILSKFSNLSLPTIKYNAIPTISFDKDIESQIIESGELINLTGQIGIKPTSESQIYYLNESTDIIIKLFNTSDNSDFIQELDYTYINNSFFLISGYIDPNINLNPYEKVNITMNSEIDLKSTGDTISLHNEDGTIFASTFVYERIKLKLDEGSIKYLTGGTEVVVNSQPTMIINFLVSTENNLFVNGLDLNATLLFTPQGESNQTERILPAVTSLNNTYQLYVSLFDLTPGNYSIKIQTANTHEHLGIINFKITERVVNTDISLEVLLLGVTGILAIVVTFVSNRVKKE